MGGREEEEWGRKKESGREEVEGEMEEGEEGGTRRVRGAREPLNVAKKVLVSEQLLVK